MNRGRYLNRSVKDINVRMKPLTSVLLLFLPLHASAGCTDAAGCWPPLGNLANGRTISATTSGSQGEIFSCSESSQPSDCLNDGKSSTQWQTKPIGSTGFQGPVYLTLSFKQYVVIENMSVWWPQFISPRAFILERSTDFGQKWSAYRYYSTNCYNIFGKTATPPFSSPPNAVDAICVEEPWSVVEQNRVSTFNFSFLMHICMQQNAAVKTMVNGCAQHCIMHAMQS